MQKSIYVGCSLKYAPQEYVQEMLAFKDKLRSKYKVFDFVGLGDQDPKEVFNWDKSCVINCDFFIAECSLPSIGIGVELGIAHTLNKPTLAIAKEDVKISKMALGMDHENFEFVRYKNLNEILVIIDKKIALISGN